MSSWRVCVLVIRERKLAALDGSYTIRSEEMPNELYL